MSNSIRDAWRILDNKFRTAESWLMNWCGLSEDWPRPVLPKNIRGHHILLEWGMILIVVTAFTRGIWPGDTHQWLPGNESGIVQSLDAVFVGSIRTQHVLPLWNPALRSGMPMLGDPFFHDLNPLAGLPVLLFGVIPGFKIAMILSFLLAAWGAWWLAAVLKCHPPVRLWLAISFAFTGQAVARFFQGEYDFVLGFAWLPWILAGMLGLVLTRRKFYLVLTSVSLALVFLSGNVYYAFYSAWMVLLFGLVFGLRIDSSNRKWGWSAEAIKPLLAAGILAFMLAAVQLLPTLQFWPHLAKARNIALTDSHSLHQIALDYLSRDVARPDARLVLPPEEFYSYTGALPFLLLILFLPYLLFKHGERRQVVLFFVGLMGFALAWIDVAAMPWRGVISALGIFNQFRYPTRMLIFGALAVLCLAALGMDAVWHTLATGKEQNGWRNRLNELLLASLILAMLFSVGDVFFTNREMLHTQIANSKSEEVVSWLRQQDSGEYFVSSMQNWHLPIAAHGMRFLDAWYGFDLIRSTEGKLNHRQVKASPKYRFSDTAHPPEAADLMGTFEHLAVYRDAQSLPLAFTVDRDILMDTANPLPLQLSEVQAVPLAAPSVNRMETIAQGNADTVLVMLVSNFPGWQARVDGRRAKVLNVEGYLAVALPPGSHQITWRYRPAAVILGGLLSLLALLYLSWLSKDVLIGLVPQVKKGMRQSKAALQQLAPRFQNWLNSTVVFSAKVTDAGLQPEQALNLPEGSRVRLLGAREDAKLPWLGWLLRWVFQRSHWGWLAFIAALGVYAFTRFLALDRYPIYFFSDEAIKTVFAQELIARGFKDHLGTWLPMYFPVAGSRWTPLISVYFQALGLALFGKSIAVTRGVSAAVGLLGAAASGLLLKDAFKSRYWWAAPLVLAVMPVWFLHSRTAFETVDMTAFYACFLWAYMRYRKGSPRALYGAVLFGGLTFYAYSNAQVLIGVTALALLVVDARYHWQQRAMIWRGLVFALFLGIPFLVFQRQHTGALQLHLRTVDSYWFNESLSLGEKIHLFLGKYLYGLSPQFWFFSNQHDLVRHRMKDLAHIPTIFMPFFLAGAWQALRKWRSAEHRALWIAMLAAPVGASLLDIGATRVMAFIVPAGVCVLLGWQTVLDWLAGRWPGLRAGWRKWLPPAVLGVGLSIGAFWLLNLSLTQAPTWFTDYGLYGMQYGAEQLFVDVLPKYLEQDPQATIAVSPTWANGTDVFVRYFYPPEVQSHIMMRTVDAYLFQKLDLNPHVLLVMPPNEYQKAVESNKFKSVDVVEIVPYPDGSPGFYLARLAYVDGVDAIFQQEALERSQPEVETVELDDQQVEVAYSRIDMGELKNIFDSDTFTLMRGLEANPFLLDFTFSQPRTVSGITADFGSMDFRITLTFYPADGGQPVKMAREFRNMPDDPHIEWQVDGAPASVSRLTMEIFNLNGQQRANIHIREVGLLP